MATAYTLEQCARRLEHAREKSGDIGRSFALLDGMIVLLRHEADKAAEHASRSPPEV